MTAAILHQPITTLDLIAQALSRDTDRLVVLGAGGERVTAADLAAQISRYQQFLEALEPKPTRAAVLSRNRIEVLYASNALNFAGIVSTALHPMGSVDDYLYVIEDASIDTLIFDAAHYEEVAQALRDRATGLRHLLALGESGIGIDLIGGADALAPRPLVVPPSDPEALFRIDHDLLSQRRRFRDDPADELGMARGHPAPRLCAAQPCGRVSAHLRSRAGWLHGGAARI
jgi:fatty-acyl-CoA synthase